MKEEEKGAGRGLEIPQDFSWFETETLGEPHAFDAFRATRLG